MKTKTDHSCSREIRLVIWFNGVFMLCSLAAAVFLMAFSAVKEKTLDNTLLVALLVQPMTVALGALSNLVTKSNAEPSGTPANPVTTVVAQPANDPIPTTNVEPNAPPGE